MYHDIYRGVQRFHNHVIIQRLADAGLLDKQRNTAESGFASSAWVDVIPPGCPVFSEFM